MTLLNLLTLFFLATTLTVSTTDEADIRRAVKQFASAADIQDAAKMRNVLHTEAQQFFMGADGLVRLETAAYLGMIEQKKIGGQPRTLHIETVDVNGDLASVSASMSNESMHFDNYISLMKIEGEWKIMSIVLRMEMK